MASSLATKRLQKEYQMMMTNPPEFIVAKPLESNILVWHYIVTGPPDSAYTGGEYHGKVIFPEEYPYKPPAIKMLTPNGRFQTDTRLCLSMSDYHPGTWNPAWSVATILTGLVSFMVEETPTTGSVKTSVADRRLLAQRSWEWNRQDARFVDVWGGEELFHKKATVAVPSVAAGAAVVGVSAGMKGAEKSSGHRKRVVSKKTLQQPIQHQQHPLQHQQQLQQQNQQNVALVQNAVDTVWAKARSNLWVLAIAALVMYLVVLKVITRLDL
ncbi:Ubiquitin-conjugating enzyme E2 6 [Podochytrium sp. JEL0797]|nr:Ubiquitin-conjugating enzyme E2 6 [Podochytrium sp. JEL0797]